MKKLNRAQKTFALLTLLFVSSLLIYQNCSVKGFKVKTSGSEAELGSNISVQYSPTQLTSALISAANLLVFRLPTSDELEYASKSKENYQKVIESYVNDQRFADAMFEEHRNYLELGGTSADSSNDIDYNLPARMGAYIVYNDRDYREVLSADYCVNSNYQTQSTCGDTFQDGGTASQNAAGVISTRSFIAAHKKNKGFNFVLVARSAKKFLCTAYPDPQDPGLAPSQISNVHKPWSDDAACFNCHRTLNPRAVLFFNYNDQGRYTADINSTTIRDTTDPAKISDLVTTGLPVTVLGRPASTLRDYGAAITDDPRFTNCMVLRYVNYMTGYNYETLPSNLTYLSDTFARSGFSVKQLLEEIATTPQFVSKR